MLRQLKMVSRRIDILIGRSFRWQPAIFKKESHDMTFELYGRTRISCIINRICN